MLPDWRDERIAELERENALLHRRVDQLEALVADLRAQLAKTSRNSSRPPSTDSATARKQRRRKRASGRTRGAQPGHEGTQRRLAPPEQVQETHDVVPEACSHCRTPLHGVDTAPMRVQRWELPEVRPEVTEWRLHALTCRSCGGVTRAAMPSELRQGWFGPRLCAFVTLLTGVLGVSKRNVQRLLSDTLGLELSLGALSKLERRASLALVAPVAEVEDALRTATCVNIDETSWSESGRKAWLWSVSTPDLALFRITPARDMATAQTLLPPDFAGVVVSDRLASYGYLDPSRRQVCWAHLDRAFEGIRERGGEGAQFGQAMKNLSRRMWHSWGQFRDGKRTRASLVAFMARLRVKVCTLLNRWAARRLPGVSGMCKQLLSIESALWTFVRLPGVEPTNNAAERALRPAVIHRKTSFGTDSPRGSLFVARMLSAAESLRRQGRSVFAFLVTLLSRIHLGLPRPSLLPVQALAP